MKKWVLFFVLLSGVCARADLRASNIFFYREFGRKVLAMDWFGLALGHKYELQSSTDRVAWRARLRITWDSSDPTAYWRTAIPMLPPTPVGLTACEYFRLVEVP